MKKGFAIQIQLSLSEEEKKVAEDFANKFIIGTLKNDMLYSKHLNTRGGYSSYLKRGVLGLKIKGHGPTTDDTLYFRRISRNQRVFGIVRLDTMQEKGTYEDLKHVKDKCMCPIHHGGTRVEWRYKPETYTYALVGDIKG